jgi:GNAT superfamily N-acetyltransferase
MLEYRRAHPSDSPALAEARLEFMRIVKDSGIADEGALRAELRSRFARELGSGSLVAWICLDAGRIVGTSGLAPAHAGGAGDEALVFNMYTSEDHRRLGIGGELLRLSLEEGRALGFRRFRLQPTDDGIGLYRRAGFVGEGRDMVLLPPPEPPPGGGAGIGPHA